MAFKGQPVPTTLETIAGCKISDGKSVRVVSSEAVEDGHFYLINNFLEWQFNQQKLVKR